MTKELAYALVTPYTIRKSRTGAVLGRLLGQVSAELVAARLFAPSREMAVALAGAVQRCDDPEEERYRQLIRDYVVENLSPAPTGVRCRALMLVFHGPNAIAEVARVAGRLRISSASGETLRDAYGDLVWNADGSVRYFEPAVVIADTRESARRDLRLWLDFARTQPEVLTGVCVHSNPAAVQQTLVLIKPDSWRERSARPGAIMDMFSRTGLRIICCRMCRISVAQALEFYGPVRDVLCRKLAPGIGQKARSVLDEEFGLHLPDEAAASLAQLVGVPYAHDQFDRIVEFMTGMKPANCPEAERTAAGKVKCLALVYEGENAVAKIRDVLGPTDPRKAPDGTVRREFGSDIMVNTAHASDSPENARREMGILRLDEPSFVPTVEQLLAASAEA